ncbi:alpha-N-acetylgalactosaminidase-like [Macrosteles quadrilineatus]|uniref:alpha-N-acetylgalactosaminidase-like n=1 Tax=Macrosteles quadrilineatus TaxID=74068 RepID=UPI0023E273B3|nr:alpha-N-acetylgalactosaminidase-like [Macrosteles quadrilineatus]
MKLHCLFVCFVVFLDQANCLNNGLALKPPMGWMSWQRYRCTTNCTLYPYECISEWLIRNATDLLVSEGYAELGYKYVIIDDCWMMTSRDDLGKLHPDPDRFPSGMHALSNYVHSKGLKFGIYQDYGVKTCAGYPGLLGHMEIDANTFAEWEVDYVKVDGCNSDPWTMDEGYPKFGRYLNKTGRPMVYSCSWPYYQREQNVPINFAAIVEHCNLWRLYEDVQDSWGVGAGSVRDIMDYYANRKDVTQYAGPGHWNDPDMLIIGNFGLTVWQSEAQMAVWAVLAAPLLLSTDLANVQPEFKHILQNKRVIAINQDPLGIQGEMIHTREKINTWVRPISPKVGEHFSFAVAFVSYRADGMPYRYNVTVLNLGLRNPAGYIVNDLFGTSYCDEMVKPTSLLQVRINPSGVVFLELKAVSQKQCEQEEESKC